MAQLKVAEEVAASEFSRMCATYRIDDDTSKLDEKDRKEWQDTRQATIGDICRGALVIDAEGLAIYTAEGGKAIKFNRPTGATYIAFETHGKEKSISNTVAGLADMTGENPSTFSKLFARDFKACSRIGGLFLSQE